MEIDGTINIVIDLTNKIIQSISDGDLKSLKILLHKRQKAMELLKLKRDFFRESDNKKLNELRDIHIELRDMIEKNMQDMKEKEIKHLIHEKRWKNAYSLFMEVKDAKPNNF